MQNTRKKIISCGIVALGIIMAPLFPFWGLLSVPILLLVLGQPMGALFFAILLDSFLVPGGVVPIWASLTFYTALCIPLYAYLRYTTTV